MRTPRLVAMAIACCAMASAESAFAGLLLNDTWADGSRTETNLPTESAVWSGISVGTGGSIATTTGVLSEVVGSSSQKLWTYFSPNGSPVTLAVGERLTATIDFTLKGNLYNNTSRSLRIGLFNDPTNSQIASDTNSDSGGAGNPWADSLGYGVSIPLTSNVATTTAPFSIQKRAFANTSLFGSTGAYTSVPSGGTPVSQALNTPYTLTIQVNRVAASQNDITVSLLSGSTLMSTHTVTDLGATFGGASIVGGFPASANTYNTFDQLFFRFSNNTTTADQFDFTRFRVETVPEPSVVWCLAGFFSAGAWLTLRRKK